MLLLENQLPFRVLQLLSDLPDNKLIEDMDAFLFNFHFSPDKKPQQKNRATEGDQPQPQWEIDVDPASPNPVHLLDELRTSFFRDFSPRRPNKLKRGPITYRNLKQLKAAGIQVKRSESKSPVDITFSSRWLTGELRLQEILVHHTSASTYLNLLAYEACPDFLNKYQISSFIKFLASMIKYPDDVKELRSCGSMMNSLGSDDKRAKFFNFIAADLVPYDATYFSVRHEIERYFQTRYRTWLAQAYHAYFSNSGSFIAFLAAFVALLLTFLQTWFTISPPN